MSGLTGVADRSFLDQQLDLAWRCMAREQAPRALVMMDIDRFKLFNDIYGHLSGDDCLRRVPQTLAGGLRRPADFLIRYGGEEFVAVRPGIGLEGALVLAESMRRLVEGLAISHGPLHGGPLGDSEPEGDGPGCRPTTMTPLWCWPPPTLPYIRPSKPGVTACKALTHPKRLKTGTRYGGRMGVFADAATGRPRY
ncbi:hypothetical protein DFAR_2690036 [Desulfarculales bacterium]